MPSPSDLSPATRSTTVIDDEHGGLLALAVRALTTVEVIVDRVGRTRRKVIPFPRTPREDDVARTVRHAACADDAARGAPPG
ncbi:hypothetical protein [Actinomycetospora cinnamomea]|uniref:Uncharacterized protein n=1 Tax=Actinomycetospora cinnamomea TaxID=663609 RepID=A0A2U1FLE4_9PSEU|nr:hypothetical protein [Actinomycetospora cinnamomea]PVZ12946.1 hypothetical protein C8D89_10294 [Actinomycetospora cinnamomea]